MILWKPYYVVIYMVQNSDKRQGGAKDLSPQPLCSSIVKGFMFVVLWFPIVSGNSLSPDLSRCVRSTSPAISAVLIHSSDP